MLIGDDFAARRELVQRSADLSRLLARLRERARLVLDRQPVIPEVKALLSVDGGICPRDGGPLVFDPWSPQSHRCIRCGEVASGERQHRWWARFQHLWLAERAAHLAAVAAFGGDPGAASRAGEILRAYGDRYLEYPNSDNVLGPSRPFFSTYLESIWITNLVAAAVLLREADLLDPSAGQAVDLIGEESANLIGEFNEGLSNRQTWHNAALAALAVWFEDEELLQGALGGGSGLLTHALQGFGSDGMWYEGENYHLFALRGLLIGLDWARAVGLDPRDEPEVAAHIRSALLAPTLSALPDATFPARKDARFGMSLAQPMYLELWEVGAGSTVDPDVAGWLAMLYARPAAAAEMFDSYLHEAGEPPPKHRRREDLSWWMLSSMPAELPEQVAPYEARSVLLESQGLAVLRRGDCYASLEAGPYGGGHGHPDRLHLTLHAAGVHWLPDPGTGSYVAPDLAWYRSTLAHNAPRLDGVSQPPGDAQCEAFDDDGTWAWAQGSYGPMRRAVVAGPDYLLDVTEVAGEGERLLELPLHLAGDIAVLTRGRWAPAELPDDFVSGAQRFLADSPGPLLLEARDAGQQLLVSLDGAEELLRATAPGTPGSTPAPFLLARTRALPARVAAAFSWQEPAALVRVTADALEVALPAGIDRHRRIVDGWQLDRPAGTVRLGGRQEAPARFEPLISQQRPFVQHGIARWVDVPPALDGTLEGFDLSAPLALDHEDQYRRSEEPYAGPDQLSATAWVNWDDEALYVAVDVVKADVVFRPAGEPPLRLDNEPDDIHSDGVQVYLVAAPDAAPRGALVVPEESDTALRVQATGGEAEPLEVSGGWSLTENGYRITLALRAEGWGDRRRGERVPFDLIVNEMHPGRERRAGQLVWSGRGGWVWLRGPRQPRAAFGELELA